MRNLYGELDYGYTLHFVNHNEIDALDGGMINTAIIASVGNKVEVGFDPALHQNSHTVLFTAIDLKLPLLFDSGLYQITDYQVLCNLPNYTAFINAKLSKLR